MRASHPKRGRKVGKTKRGKGTKIMAIADRTGLPISVCVESATPHEVTLAWLQNFRRLVVRYERYAENFLSECSNLPRL
jgi:hypothetical protein